MNFIQVGWFIVGDEDAKFGPKEYGEAFEPLGGNLGYWEGRGYYAVAAYIQNTDE
jgi:hypothetical protein